MNKLDFYAFHLMPYPYIPPGEEIESTWVTLLQPPLRPEGRAPRSTTSTSSSSVAAERLGYDGVVRERAPPERLRDDAVARTSWPPYLVAQTERIPIGIIGNALPLHVQPRAGGGGGRDARRDLGRADHLRLRARDGHGVPLLRRQPDATRSERFWEAHDLIIKAWTEPGPFDVGGQALRPPVRQPLAAAAPEAPPADLAAGLRARSRPSARRLSCATRS